MLEAVLDRVRREYPAARIAVPAYWPTEMRRRYQLLCTVPRDKWPLDIANFASAVPRSVRQQRGLLAPADVDVILDVSGFGYGDYWGLKKLKRRLANPLRHWKRGRRRAILLPQALGPFTGDGMRQAFATVLDRADLVFVRDRTSLGYVEAVCRASPNVRLAPDFTNLLHPALPSHLAPLAGSSIVIPNQKLVAAHDQATRQSYLTFMRLAIELLARDGGRVQFLIHEGVGDRQLAEEVNASLAAPVPILDETSPLTTKAIIAAAHVVVSSRFHGLVSALSAGVPALACGWSHKYSELMADYGCSEYLVDLNDEPSWHQRLHDLVYAARNPHQRANLQDAATQQRARTETMWQAVFAVMSDVR